MSAPRTKVTIERLVLRGVDAQQTQALAESLQKELTRTLAQPGSRARLQRVQDAPVIRLGHVPLKVGEAGARKFGTSLARAITKGVGK